MTVHMRPYAGAADLQRILDLKRTCTSPENMYDAPTISTLRTLLAPLPQGEAVERPPWKDGLTFSHNFRGELVIESIKEESRQEKGCA